MPVTKVKTKWVSGNLVFYDVSGDEIFTIDGANRKMSFPSGSSIDLPDEVLQAADIALVQGSILLGNAAGAAAALVAKTSGRILVGDGTTLALVALSGDATMASGGAITLAVPKVSVLTEEVTAVGMTDVDATHGTKVLSGSIPKGAVILGTKVLISTAFAGDTTALFTIGDGSDVDRYMTGTPDAFGAAPDGLEMGVPSGALLLTAANNPKIEITTTADATNMISGGGVAEVNVFYIATL